MVKLLERTKQEVDTAASIIANHWSASLSELDMMIVNSVPPGGNWKNIPESVPSKRLEQIRISYAAGEGSRSTYYGRLKAEHPSYTINTYFGRPGNGCHIHYGQDRVLSAREAARLQSFPDNFVFEGSKSSIATQIGNAVPPLLAYQIAKALPYKGQFVDLFAGAGGMALGFIWAGWEPIIANDIDKNFVATYRKNIHDAAIAGDICDPAVFMAVVDACKTARKKSSKTPLFVIGGPPCQGFSTAGNKRSMSDQRNWLFKQYRQMLEMIEPTGFVFENVTGLLNMEGGRVFEMVRRELESATKSLEVWKMRAEEYGVPQRRTRVVLVGNCTNAEPIFAPARVTQFDKEKDPKCLLRTAISVEEALSDLPSIKAGEDGSMKKYSSASQNAYQGLMRTELTAEQYLVKIKPKDKVANR